MSHISTIMTKLVSTEHIVKALRDMGFSKVAVPNTDKIIIRAKEGGFPTFDIRFLRTKEGRFNAQISDYDQERFDKLWMQTLTQRYAYHVAIDALKEEEFEMIEESLKGGNAIHLTLRRMAG
jgi:hypothetical protein